MIFAYLRVSTGKQTLANQQNEISKFTNSRNLQVDRWVTEIVSGKNRDANANSARSYDA